MSYCRYNSTDSDVYVIASVSGSLECLCCPITGEPYENDIRHGHFATHSRTDMIEHLNSHRKQGQKVPDRAIQRLQNERKELGDGYE